MVKHLSLDERIELALKHRREGANCSRCVALSFPDYTEAAVSAQALGALADGLGGGVGGSGLTCGAVTAMAMVDGLARPADMPKAQIYKRVGEMTAEFNAMNGSTCCNTLKQELHRDCTRLILDAVTILHNRLAAAE